MEALTRSSSKIFSDNYINRAFLSSRALLHRPEIRFLRSQKLINVDFSHSISLQYKSIESFSCFCFSSEAQVDWENAEAHILANYQSKTVHVKFQLQKECLFGQQFLLVGDHPIFGLWDPSNAIPLNWSDGHIWTVELDIPVGKTVQFKFILKGTAGEVVWQPGQDRILQTWETENTIIVSEDWENAEVRKLSEEPMVNPIMELLVPGNLTYPKEEAIANASEKTIIAENISCPQEEPMATAYNELVVEMNTNHLKEPMATANNQLIVPEDITFTKEHISMVNKTLQTAENITYSEKEHMSNADKEFMIAENILKSNGKAINTKDENLTIYEGGSVLVPGLTPLPAMTTQDSSPEEVGKSAASIGAGNADLHHAFEKNQLHGGQEPGGDSSQEEITLLFNDGPERELHVDGLEEKLQLIKDQEQSNPKLADDDYISQPDMQWGYKTLRKLLGNLSFLRDLGFLRSN